MQPRNHNNICSKLYEAMKQSIETWSAHLEMHNYSHCKTEEVGDEMA